MLAHPAQTSLKRMSLKLILVIVMICTAASGLVARTIADNMGWNGPASYYKVDHQVDLPSQTYTVRK